MDNLEKKLAGFRLSEPPAWLKARALVAADNALGRQNRARRIKTILWAAIAAGLALAMLGHYIAGALAPLTGQKPSPVQAAPIGPLPGMPFELLDGGALQEAARDLGDFAAGCLAIPSLPLTLPTGAKESL
jgi:hypothetical protein